MCVLGRVLVDQHVHKVMTPMVPGSYEDVSAKMSPAAVIAHHWGLWGV